MSAHFNRIHDHFILIREEVSIVGNHLIAITINSVDLELEGFIWSRPVAHGQKFATFKSILSGTKKLPLIL